MPANKVTGRGNPLNHFVEIRERTSCSIQPACQGGVKPMLRNPDTILKEPKQYQGCMRACWSRCWRSQKTGEVNPPYRKQHRTGARNILQLVFLIGSVTNRHRQQRCNEAQGRRRDSTPASLSVTASTGYLATFGGGRKFSITHSSLLDPSLTLNAKRRLSG